MLEVLCRLISGLSDPNLQPTSFLFDSILPLFKYIFLGGRGQERKQVCEEDSRGKGVREKEENKDF